MAGAESGRLTDGLFIWMSGSSRSSAIDPPDVLFLGHGYVRNGCVERIAACSCRSRRRRSGISRRDGLAAEAIVHSIRVRKEAQASASHTVFHLGLPAPRLPTRFSLPLSHAHIPPPFLSSFASSFWSIMQPITSISVLSQRSRSRYLYRYKAFVAHHPSHSQILEITTLRSIINISISTSSDHHPCKVHSIYPNKTSSGYIERRHLCSTFSPRSERLSARCFSLRFDRSSMFLCSRPSAVCAVSMSVVFDLCCESRRMACVSFVTQRLDLGSTSSILHRLVINISTSSFSSHSHLCLTPSSTPAHTLIDTPDSLYQRF